MQVGLKCILTCANVLTIMRCFSENMSRSSSCVSGRAAAETEGRENQNCLGENQRSQDTKGNLSFWILLALFLLDLFCFILRCCISYPPESCIPGTVDSGMYHAFFPQVCLRGSLTVKGGEGKWCITPRRRIGNSKGNLMVKKKTKKSSSPPLPPPPAIIATTTTRKNTIISLTFTSSNLLVF